MNKLDKFLSKLSDRERSVVLECLVCIKSKRFNNLDIKKLKGFNNFYRVRKSKMRIIFEIDGNEIRVIKIDKRNDNTYDSLINH